MNVIEFLQKVFPWIVGLQFWPKIIISFIVVAIAVLVVLLIWMPANKTIDKPSNEVNIVNHNPNPKANENPQSPKTYVGGIVGFNGGGKISNCTSNVKINIKTDNPADVAVGGIAGGTSPGTEVTNTHSTSEITITQKNK